MTYSLEETGVNHYTAQSVQIEREKVISILTKV